MNEYLYILIMSFVLGLCNQPGLNSMSTDTQQNTQRNPSWSVFGFLDSVWTAGKTSYHALETAKEMSELFYHLVKGGCKFAINDVKTFVNACKIIKNTEKDNSKSEWEKMCSISRQLTKIGIWVPVNWALVTVAAKGANFLSVGKIIVLLAAVVILKNEFSDQLNGLKSIKESIYPKLIYFYDNYIVENNDDSEKTSDSTDFGQ